MLIEYTDPQGSDAWLQSRRGVITGSRFAGTLSSRQISEGRRRPVAVFSLEMSAESLVRRMRCCHARVCFADIARGFATNDQHGRLMASSEALRSLPLYLDDTAGLDVMELRSRARRLGSGRRAGQPGPGPHRRRDRPRPLQGRGHRQGRPGDQGRRARRPGSPRQCAGSRRRRRRAT